MVLHIHTFCYFLSAPAVTRYASFTVHIVLCDVICKHLVVIYSVA